MRAALSARTIAANIPSLMNEQIIAPAADLTLLLAPAPLPRMKPETREAIERVAGGPLVRDLLFLMPTGSIDRRNRVGIAYTQEGEIATLLVEVDKHLPSGRAGLPYRIRLRDETGFLSAAFFRPNVAMLKRQWPEGQQRLISGKINVYGKTGERQMVHPDYVADPAKGEELPVVEPIYPLTAGLAGRTLQRAIKSVLPRLGEPPEWLDGATLSARVWASFAKSLKRQHEPEEPADVTAEGPYRMRLAYDELFVRQCALHLRRAARRAVEGRSVASTGARGAKLIASLPFALTGAQARADKEIAADMARASPMLRLLQGDVGSGKTLVAAMAMARAAEAGVQSALMAPTEILARQHAANLAPLLDAAGVKYAVLTGRDRGKERAVILEGLASGAIETVIGTHALFQDEGLVKKGAEPHVLVMSATPIPRTLALAVHGDMDISVLDEKPPGRQSIRTIALPTTRLHELAERIADVARNGERAYWVCPLIEESEAVDLAAVEDRYASLKEQFGDGVALVHGRMSAAERDTEMERFKKGDAFLLVATTVIEVGVDIPEATIMVIEHAERFGLAQMHQLRGRVGRGAKQSSCILLWRPPLGVAAKERLDLLRRTDDGFLIAEADYKLRGMGDIMGVRQSGMPAFKFVVPEAHGDLLPAADREARLAIDRDPELTSPRGQAIRFALALFGFEEGGGLARSG